MVLYLRGDQQGAGLRSSYHCRFFFSNRGYVIKRSIYARQCDVPPGQFIEHPRGYFHVNVTRVKIRNNRRSPRSLKKTSAHPHPRHLEALPEWPTFVDRPSLVKLNRTDGTLRLFGKKPDCKCVNRRYILLCFRLGTFFANVQRWLEFTMLFEKIIILWEKVSWKYLYRDSTLGNVFIIEFILGYISSLRLRIEKFGRW